MLEAFGVKFGESSLQDFNEILHLQKKNTYKSEIELELLQSVL